MIAAAPANLPKTAAGGSGIPPAAPWIPIEPIDQAGGYLTIYYNDDMSRLPVRWVTKPGDNKSDPNLETLTYGLFSTCGPAMRRGFVHRRAQFLFFGTRRRGQRVLSGYYKVRWFTHGPLGAKDLCLAAECARFVAEPIPFSEIDRRCGTSLSRWFRNMRLLSASDCANLKRLIDARPDATAEYCDEIARLERFNFRYGGYRYIGWRQTESFSWEYAKTYLDKCSTTGVGGSSSNSSTTGLWLCGECGEVVKNKALLKRCPSCGAMGVLQPKGGANG